MGVVSSKNYHRKKKENEHLKTENKKQAKNIDDLNTKIHTLKNKNNTLINNVKDLNNALAQKEFEKNILKIKINDCKQIEEEQNSKIKQKNQKIIDLEKINQNLTNKLECVQNNKLFLLKKIEKYQNEINLNKEKKEFYSSFENEIINKKIELFINNNQSNINKIIENNFKNFFNTNIKDEMKNIINDHLLNKENFSKYFYDRIDNLCSNSIIDFSKKTKHLNIVLIGMSGVGKSTLINSFLKRDEAKSFWGEPCTQITSFYESKNLRFWDTKGIELNDYNLNVVIEETIKLIKDNNKSGDPDKYIHCIWYCITGTRFQEVEKKAINQLMSQYDENSLPILLVYTFAHTTNFYNNMKEYVKKVIPKKIDILPILAKDVSNMEGNKTRAFGHNKLIKKSIKKFKNAIDHISFSTVKNRVNQQINEYINSFEDYFTNINNKLDELNDFDKAKNYLKKHLNKFSIKITGQEVNSLSDFIINNNIDKWALNCFITVQTYKDDLLKTLKDKIKNIYSEELNNYRRKKNNINLDEIEDSRHQILFCNNISNEIEKFLNNQIENFNAHQLLKYILIEYYQIIKDNAIINTNEIIQNLKANIIQEMQNEIEYNPHFNNLFKY